MEQIHTASCRRFLKSGRWPFHRGTRAGKKVKKGIESHRQHFVEAITPGSVNQNSPLRRPRSARPSSLFAPSILLSNVMSLAPKRDKVREATHYANYDLVCITESLLKEHMGDNYVAISGYNLKRFDQT